MPGIVFSEASGLNNSLYGNVQGPVQEIILSKARSMEEKEAIVKKLFKMTNSTHFGETYTELTSMDGFAPTPENGAMHIAGMQEGHRKFIQNVNWTNSFRISRNMIDDCDVIGLRERPEAFIASYYSTREQYAAALFGAAISGSAASTFKGQLLDTKSADDNLLFYNAHPSAVDSSYTQTNLCSNTLTADNLGLVETAMQNLCDDNGENLGIAPTTIVIPNVAAMKKAAFAAAGSVQDPSNDYNAFNYHVGRWNIIVWAALNKYVTLNGASSPWFLLDEDYNQMYSGAIFQERQNLEVDSYEDKNTKANIWTGFSRFAAGFKDWRAFFAAGISTAGALS